MRNAVFGALIAVTGALSAMPAAQAQDYGWSYGHAPYPSRWERDAWRQRP